jgi:hypothetical protein
MTSVIYYFFVSFGSYIKNLLYLLDILKKRVFNGFSLYLFNLINTLLIFCLKNQLKLFSAFNISI